MRKFCAVLITVFLGCCLASAQTPHPSFSLSWTASIDATTNPSLTYNVYRVAQACPTSGQPSGMVKVNTTPVTTTSYTDTAVSIGQSYCYAVTSVLNSAESADSNFAGGVSLPSAPSGLSAKSN